MKCNLIILINNEPILIRSTQAAGIVLDTFAGEAGKDDGGEEVTTGTSTATSTVQASHFLALEFSIAKHSHTHAYQKLMYVYMYLSSFRRHD